MKLGRFLSTLGVKSHKKQNEDDIENICSIILFVFDLGES